MFYHDEDKLALIYESIRVKRMGPTNINKQDLSNFLFKITDGGRELFSIFTIRKNDSTKEPAKKAGDILKITGKLGACSASWKASKTRRPDLDTPVQYKKNQILRICVTAVDGENYLKKYPAAKRTRSFDVTEIYKIEAGFKTYNVI